MRTGYHYLYKYLILYIVLSFIDNKNIINCEKVKGVKAKMQDLNKQIAYDGVNGTRSINAFGNYSALTHRTDHETSDDRNEVTCFTCVNVSNNHICNQFAIDRPCNLGNNFCHTLHIMDPNGGTVLVNKKCANETECSPRSIGCYVIDNQKICISCCDENYCNQAVPTKRSNATFRNTRTLERKKLEAFNERVTKNKQLRNNSTMFHPSLSFILSSIFGYIFL